MKPSFTVTHSFLSQLIEKSKKFSSNEEVFEAFEKLSSVQTKVLDEKHLAIIDDEKAKKKFLFENIAPQLLPLAEDLYSFVEVDEVN